MLFMGMGMLSTNEMLLLAWCYLTIGGFSASIAYDKQKAKMEPWTFQLWWPFKAVVLVLMGLVWPSLWLWALVRWMFGA